MIKGENRLFCVYLMFYDKVNFDKNATFLVTGGAGFIGSNLCEALLNMGYSVRCLDNLSTGKLEYVSMFQKYQNYQFIEGDIRDYNTCLESCKNIQYILHQAAWGSVPRSIKMPIMYEDVNVKGTLNMLEAAKENGVKKFVYASSSSVYGDTPNLPKKEGYEGKLLSPYALTKKINEEYSRLYTELYGVDTYGLRYFNVFGKHQNSDGMYAAVIPKFISSLLYGKNPVIYGDGKQSRDFTYITNVIDANLKACMADHKAAGQVFNIAYGGRESVQNIYTILCKELNIYIPPKYESERLGDIKHSNADISKAVELLHYDPKYSFEDGIKLTLEWYKKNLT